MKIEITDRPELLEPEWWRLWRRCECARVFQSPAWLLPWGREFARQRLVLAAFDGDDLVGLLPLVLIQGRWTLWGAGTSDWLDGIFAPGFSADAFLPQLEGLNGPLDLFQLPPGSPLAELARSRDVPVTDGEPCVVLDLSSPLPSSAAQNVAYYQRRLQRAGVAGPIRMAASGFEALVDLHGRRWRQKGLPGVLHDPKVLAWHREAVPQLEAAGLLRLYGLTLGDCIVGVLYGLADTQQVSYYLSGYDPDLAALGLGTVLVGHAIAEARREGCARFDFLRGQESYKFRWGAANRRSATATFEFREPAFG
jgi:CelD/BcsL family acetyltransferase involved in cellulose biosynthesis